MTETRSRRSTDRRSDRYSDHDEDYSPSRSSRWAPRRDGYEDEAPYDTLYRRSYEAPDNSRRDSGHHSNFSRHGHHDSYDDDAAYAREHQRQVTRTGHDDRVSSYPDQGRNSQSGYDHSQRRSSQMTAEEDEEGERLKGPWGKEKKDLAATAIGAVAGAFLGHEAGHGKPMGILGGAVLGGISANAMEHAHIKREHRREYEQRSSQYES